MQIDVTLVNNSGVDLLVEVSSAVKETLPSGGSLETSFDALNDATTPVTVQSGLPSWNFTFTANTGAGNQLAQEFLYTPDDKSNVNQFIGPFKRQFENDGPLVRLALLLEVLDGPAEC